MDVEGFKQQLQIGAMNHSPEGFERVKNVEKQALCLLSQADYMKIAPLVLYIFRQAWTGAVDYQVSLPAALPEHWLTEVTLNEPSRMASEDEWTKWRAKYLCPPLAEVKETPPVVAVKEETPPPPAAEKKETPPPATPAKEDGTKRPERDTAAADCAATGGTWANGTCSLPTAQTNGAADTVPADKSLWPLLLVAGAGVAIVGGIVWWLKRR